MGSFVGCVSSVLDAEASAEFVSWSSFSLDDEELSSVLFAFEPFVGFLFLEFPFRLSLQR